MKLTTVLITLIAFGLIDLYVYKGISGIIQDLNPAVKLTTAITYWVISIITICLLIYGISNRASFGSANTLTIIIGIFITLLLPKLVFMFFHAVDDLVNLAGLAYNNFSAETDYSRRNFISQIGLVTSGFMLGSMVYGVLWGKFSFRVIKEQISSSKIPAAFEGVKIVQISDAHLGSFGDSFEPVKQAVKMINDLDPDYVFFTGDMVNNHADEASSWVDIFKQIKAKAGKFSIFGNHDYADYGSYSADEKKASVEKLRQIHQQMGFRLLEDEHIKLERSGESITLVGVHNWGKGFHQIGDLNKAITGANTGDFKILLSHDPTHYEEQVKYKTDIDLTLSGHTHGMQMGIEIPALNFKWSPVKMRYRRWAGLYEDNDQKIYINRGFGVLAYPGRVGMSPEITLFTLRSLQA
jgi:predicted MPP superfamily phosphohydrolase